MNDRMNKWYVLWPVGSKARDIATIISTCIQISNNRKCIDPGMMIMFWTIGMKLASYAILNVCIVHDLQPVMTWLASFSI